MTEHEKRKANAEAQARSRQGVKAELREIKAEIADLRHDVHEVLTSVVASRAFVQKGSDYAD